MALAAMALPSDFTSMPRYFRSELASTAFKCGQAFSTEG